MRAPDEQAERRWEDFRRAVVAIGIDADTAVVMSASWGRAMPLRGELELLGVMVDELKRANPTSKQIADRLRRIIDDLDEVAKLHWPRRRLYQEARRKVAEAAAMIRPERDVLDAAPRASSKNAASAEGVFRQHALRIWTEIAGARHADRGPLITFVHAAECAFLAKTKRDTVRTWLARARHMADMKR